MYLIPPFLLYWNLGEMNVVSERCGVVQFLFFFLGKKKREKTKKGKKSLLSPGLKEIWWVQMLKDINGWATRSTSYLLYFP
jgi:hypothetical protein